MTDRRSQRSSAPEDPEAFAPERLPALREAVRHLSWLADLGYTGTAPLKLVGDRFALTARQRQAVKRCACARAPAEAREAKRVPHTAPGGYPLAGRRLAIDGFNLLITLETALGGGVVLGARDGCLRDLAYLRGTWRRVLQTEGALRVLGTTLEQARIAGAHVWLDARVSNSGRLAAMLREAAATWSCEVSCETASQVDARLADSHDIVVSADSVVLDACQAWTNLARAAIDAHVPGAWRVELWPEGADEPR